MNSISLDLAKWPKRTGSSEEGETMEIYLFAFSSKIAVSSKLRLIEATRKNQKDFIQKEWIFIWLKGPFFQFY